jgi:hypothetical protein
MTEILLEKGVKSNKQMMNNILFYKILLSAIILQWYVILYHVSNTKPITSIFKTVMVCFFMYYNIIILLQIFHYRPIHFKGEVFFSNKVPEADLRYFSKPVICIFSLQPQIIKDCCWQYCCKIDRSVVKSDQLST